MLPAPPLPENLSFGHSCSGPWPMNAVVTLMFLSFGHALETWKLCLKFGVGDSLSFQVLMFSFLTSMPPRPCALNLPKPQPQTRECIKTSAFLKNKITFTCRRSAAVLRASFFPRRNARITNNVYGFRDGGLFMSVSPLAPGSCGQFGQVALILWYGCLVDWKDCGEG